MRNRGFTLILSIFLITAILIILSSMAYIIYNSNLSLKYQRDALRAYYLAEAAIEYGKARLRSNPDWCTPGTIIKVKDGSFEVKREFGQSFLFGHGYANRAHAIIRLDVILNSTYLQREE
jgi:Tfp pilus assembly protein PilE